MWNAFVNVVCIVAAFAFDWLCGSHSDIVQLEDLQ